MSRSSSFFMAVVFVGVARTAGAQSGTATLTGSVLIDSLRLPIEGAEVLLPRLSKQTRAGRDGRFRIEDIPPGIHELVVRQVGYAPQTMELAFAPKDRIDRTILLRRAQTLDPVNVEAASGIASFEEHRKLGLGSFLTRAELEKKDNHKLSDIVTQLRGARVQLTGGNRGFLYSGRRMVSSIDPRGTKGSSDTFAKENAGTGGNSAFCYAQVWLDDHILYRGAEGEQLFDINTIAPSQIEAMEYYSGPSSTPFKYSRSNSQCGVLVIHTRRTPGTSKP
jgi:hypothetical protein